MAELQRHRLVWPSDDGWSRLLAVPPEAAGMAACLQHWAANDLPLVVTRQPPAWIGVRGDEPLTLGLAAPACWGRARLVVQLPAAALRRRGEFPPATAVLSQLPGAAHAGWRTLCAGLEQRGVIARVYGSHGWQRLTGLDYLHDRSDIDLLLAVGSIGQADAALALLQRAPIAAPRIDGELVFFDGAAVAWREWAVWRSGRVARVLVKRLDGAALEDPRDWALAA